MTEPQTTLETNRRFESDGGQAVLATAIGVKGSSCLLTRSKMKRLFVKPSEKSIFKSIVQFFKKAFKEVFCEL